MNNDNPNGAWGRMVEAVIERNVADGVEGVQDAVREGRVVLSQSPTKSWKTWAQILADGNEDCSYADDEDFACAIVAEYRGKGIEAKVLLGRSEGAGMLYHVLIDVPGRGLCKPRDLYNSLTGKV